MSIKSLVEELASDLNDDEQGHEFQTWSPEDIRVWVIEGINLIYDRRPDLFMEHVIIKVDPCSIIQDTCECDSIRRVFGQVTENGRLIKQLRKRGLEVSFEWTGKTCRKRLTAGDEFKLDSYAIDTFSDTLYVWPEVPPGVDVWIKAECAHRPTEDELADDGYEVPEGAMVATKQWALWRAKSVDAEVSSPASNAAQLHYRAFFEVLGLSAETSTVIHKREKD